MAIDVILRHTAHAGVRAAPSFAAVLAAIAGLPLQSWVYIAALVYTIAQIAYLAWKWVREWRASRPPPAPAKPTVPKDT